MENPIKHGLMLHKLHCEEEPKFKKILTKVLSFCNLKYGLPDLYFKQS